MDLGLRGRTALVCASTGGLGRATAEALSAEGARVIINGRRADLAEQIAASLPGAVAVSCDVTAPGAAGELVASVREATGGEIDIAVLNGPGPRPAEATEIDAKDLRAALDSLLIFQQSLVAQVLPGMRSRGWGRILAVGSSGVLEPIAGLTLSNVGRAALAAYLKSLATEVAGDGVTVNMLVPGRIDTDRVQSLDAARAEREGRPQSEVAAAAASTIPAGRYGTAVEFGAVAAFLCSERAAYITGSAVRCDGGMVHHL